MWLSKKLFALAPRIRSLYVFCIYVDKMGQNKVQVMLQGVRGWRLSSIAQGMNSFNMKVGFLTFHCIMYNNSLMLSISAQIAIYLFIYISHIAYNVFLQAELCYVDLNLMHVLISFEWDTLWMRSCSNAFWYYYTTQYRINSNHTKSHRV